MIKKGKSYPISIHDLMVVNGEKFRPRVLQEYFKEDGVNYRNTFKPSKYMTLKGKPSKQPQSILDLLFHITDYDTEKYDYLVNSLAYFFKYLKKAQVAIALIGNQGAGKGILFYIISELFGQKYCITINSDSLNSKYKAKIIKDKLFYNFDEITLSTSKSNDSFIKAIITNPSISLEEKNITMNEEIELYGQCLFSSNHRHALKIEEGDRRFTVINTGDNLSKSNFLCYGSYNILKAAIDGDLEDFARYLKNYDVNVKLANSALDTPEKRSIINASKDNLADFHKAIIDLDISYFDELQETSNSLYFDMAFDFRKGKIDRANISKSYNMLFSGKNTTSKELMERLRGFQPYDIFQDENMSHSGNKHYYHLEGRR